MTKALGRHVTFGLFALFVAACSGGNVDPDDRIQGRLRRLDAMFGEPARPCRI